MHSYIGVTIDFISNQKLTMLCWLADDRKPHLEEIASNVEIINKRIFSVAARMFAHDRCRSTVKDWKP